MEKKYIQLFLILFTVISFSQTTSGKYTVKNLASNSKYQDFGPTYQSQNKIIFASARSGGLKWNNKEPYLDLFRATITEDGDFTSIKRLPPNINGKYHESSVSFSPDKRTVYFTKNDNFVSKKLDLDIISSDTRRDIRQVKKDKKAKQKLTYFLIYRADVSSDGNWYNITSLPFNNKNYSVGHPAVSPDGTKLYFASDMPGAYGGQDIFVVDILANGKYSEPRNMGEKINTKGSEMFPYIDSKNTLYFSSNSRKGGFGGLDIYAAKLYTDGAISEVLNLGKPINSGSDDFGYALNNNTNQGYFSSNREGGKGSDDIYHLSVVAPLKFECTQFLEGTLTNNRNGKPIAKAIVKLYHKNGDILNTTKTNGKGIFKFDIPCETNLKIVASKSKFNDSYKEFVTSKKQDEVVKVSLQLKPIIICKQNITGIVKHQKTGNRIANAIIKIVNHTGKNQTTLKTNKNGIFTLNLPCKSDYKFTASKLKFKSISYHIKTKKNPKKSLALVFNLKPTIDTTEVKLVRNKVLVKINPIYFELNKAYINKATAHELDKVVKLMKKYPQLTIESGSHTDSRAPNSYNLKLSTRRAESTVAYIISGGIDSQRITAKGYGESQLINHCTKNVACTNAEHEKNRRTEFVILNPSILDYID